MSGPLLLLGAMALLAAAAWLVADWWARPSRPPMRPRPHASRLQRYLSDLVIEGELEGWTPRRILVTSLSLGLVVGLAVNSVLGWLIPAVLAAGVPGLALIAYAERRRGALRQARQEALPEALDRLRDQLGASHGLHEAIMGLADTAPPPLRVAFRHLQRDLQRREDLVQALHASQVRLADPMWDSCVAVLALAHEFGGGQLRTVLGQLAATARADVQARRAISAAQAGSVTSARIVGLAGVAIVLYVRIGYPGADRFYASPLGEAVLLACLLAMIAGYAWMHHIARVPPTPRPHD